MLGEAREGCRGGKDYLWEDEVIGNNLIFLTGIHKYL